jgi:hypothetical protein
MTRKDDERYEAIRRDVIAKLVPRRPDLVGLPVQELARRLVEEALKEHWDEPLQAGHFWEPVEQVVYRAINEATGAAPGW